MSITHVAKLAGVSSSTVSRVINNNPRVAPETLKSVRRAMEVLRYAPSERRPGPKPQSRQKAAAKEIAFLVLGASGAQATPAFAELLRGVSMAAAEHGANMSLHYVPQPEQLPPRLAELKIDGVLLHGARPGPEVGRWLRTMPAVWLMGNRRRPEWGDQVRPDSYEVGHLAATYLVHRGHDRLAFLNLDAGHWPFRMYYQGFAAAAADLDTPVVAVEQNLVPAEDYWRRHSRAAVEALTQAYLALSPRPTGVFVADDMQVAVIQPALQAAGATVGEGHVEVVSCNNERPFLVGLTPPPAVVDIRVESIGRRGVEQLMWRMSRPEVAERMVSTIEPFLLDAQTESVWSPPPIPVGAAPGFSLRMPALPNAGDAGGRRDGNEEKVTWAALAQR